MDNATIAAVSTPYGKGGVAVIRVSGDLAINVADKCFSAKSGKKIADIPTHRAVYGNIVFDGKVIDDVVLTLFRAPASYTGEDTVEISCHGGILVTQKVLECLLKSGARAALPGEYTRRAFINGKLSLSKAEAIIDVIDAQTDDKLALARANAGGVLSDKIQSIYDKLCTLVSTAYVFADYPDEDLTDISSKELQIALLGCLEELEKLSATYKSGHAINDGIYTAIVGRPNTGKSSLLNALLGNNRAIVSDVAGTTRDTVEESVSVGSITLRLCDTAGIRETEDTVEKIGVERSLAAIEKAELILAVFDVSSRFTDEDEEILKVLEKNGCEKIAVLNKSDMSEGDCIATELSKRISDNFENIITISAKNGDNVPLLCEKIEKLFVENKIDYDTCAILTRARQKNAVDSASESIRCAISALENGFTPDVAGMDIEDAMSKLLQVDSREVSADIVDSIFHRFCVGK